MFFFLIFIYLQISTEKFTKVASAVVCRSNNEYRSRNYRSEVKFLSSSVVFAKNDEKKSVTYAKRCGAREFTTKKEQKSFALRPTKEQTVASTVRIMLL